MEKAQYIDKVKVPEFERGLKARIAKAIAESEAFAVNNYINVCYAYFKDIETRDFFGKNVAETDNFALSVCSKASMYSVDIYREFRFNPKYDDDFACETYSLRCELELGTAEKYEGSDYFELAREDQYYGDESFESDEENFWLRVRNYPLYQKVKDMEPVSVEVYAHLDT